MREALIFRIEDIPDEGLEENFSKDESWLEERLIGEKERTFHFVPPISVNIRLSRSGRSILIRSRFEAQVEWLCARCLEPFSRPLKSEYTIHLKPKPSHPWPEELELSREDLETEFYEGEEKYTIDDKEVTS